MIQDETALADDYPPALRPLIGRFDPTWPPVIEVSRGWYPLLIDLDRTLVSIAPGYVVHQVKSKFGSLHFYASPSGDPSERNEEFQDAILAAEWQSIETCEDCGEPAQQYVLRLWVATLCSNHAAEAARNERSGE